jgi:hypothetical protein
MHADQPPLLNALLDRAGHGAELTRDLAARRGSSSSTIHEFMDCLFRGEGKPRWESVARSSCEPGSLDTVPITINQPEQRPKAEPIECGMRGSKKNGMTSRKRHLRYSPARD